MNTNVSIFDIRQAITRQLNKKFKYETYFDNIDVSDGSYFYVEMLPIKLNTIDDVYTNKVIQVDIVLYLESDENGKVNRRELYDSIEILDRLFRPVLAVKDRYITVLSSETTIQDDILHYIFELNFVDCLNESEMDSLNYELMQTLGLQIKEM